MRKYFYIGILLLWADLAVAQDLHFSQFFAAPLLTNPANTGNFNGNFRIGGNYRDQWGSVTVPYQTFSAYADGAIQPKKAVNRLGLGLVAFNDIAGDGDLTTNKIYFSSAYHIGYTENDYWRLAIGLTGGIVQKSVDINKLLFDSQWNDFQFDPALPNNETPSKEITDYVDLGAGALLTLIPYEGERYSIGFSAWHINEPEETFFENPNTIGIRYTLTAGGFFATGGVASFQPQLYVSSQKNALEIIAGTNISIPMNTEEATNTSIFMGGWYRYNDAFWMVGGAQVNNLTFSLSYDLNVSKLHTASSHLGGLELAAAYVFNKKEKKDPLRCPAYE